MTMTSRSNGTLVATLRRVSLAAALAFVGAPLALSAISAPAMAQAGGGGDRGGGDGGGAGMGGGGGSSDGIYDMLNFDAQQRAAAAVPGQGPQQPPSFARQRRITPMPARGEYAQNPCGQIRIVHDINGDPIRYTCIR